MARVALDRVSRSYARERAVDHVSLDIADGEFVVLLGPSGCGKTTTLNMIAGLDTPTAGRILIDDRPVEHLPPDRRDIAMVFQSIALYPHMTVFDNIAFPLRRTGVAKQEIPARVQRVADMLKVAEFLQRKPHQLSGGQRQRVAIGRAAVREPAVFLFDEPLSSLDAKLRVDMRIELKKLHERLNATFIYVTHDQVEAMTMADRIAVMNGGRLMQYDTPRRIYRRPTNRWVAGFVGSPAMNLLEGELVEQGGGLRLRTVGGDIILPAVMRPALEGGNTADGGYAIGIRPEAVAIAGTSEGPAIPVAGRVFAIEPVGSDLFVDVALGENSEPPVLKLRTDPDRELSPGDPLKLELPHDRLYLFAPGGGRIYPGPES